MGHVTVYGQEYFLKTKEIDLDQANAFAFRRALGLEPKNRVEVRVRLEKELLDAYYEASGTRPKGGELSDTINRAVAGYMILHGMI